jgi:acyl-CoA hydrolase
VILEVNSAHALGFEGMHDIQYGTGLPPHRRPLPVLHPSSRIGDDCLGHEVSRGRPAQGDGWRDALDPRQR